MNESSIDYCEALTCVHCTAIFYCIAGTEKYQSCRNEKVNEKHLAVHNPRIYNMLAVCSLCCVCKFTVFLHVQRK